MSQVDSPVMPLRRPRRRFLGRSKQTGRSRDHAASNERSSRITGFHRPKTGHHDCVPDIHGTRGCGVWALVSQFSYRDAICVVIFSVLVVRFARHMISQNRDKRKKSHQQRQGVSESQATGLLSVLDWEGAMDVTSRRHVQARPGPGLCYSKPATEQDRLVASQGTGTQENRDGSCLSCWLSGVPAASVHGIPLCQTLPRGNGYGLE